MQLEDARGNYKIVARLFNMVQPQVAVFGRKDYQQLQVIRYMTTEMSFPVEIVPATKAAKQDPSVCLRYE